MTPSSATYCRCPPVSADSIDDVKSNITEMRNALTRHYYLELEHIRSKHDKDLQALDRLESELSLDLFTDTSAN